MSLHQQLIVQNQAGDKYGKNGWDTWPRELMPTTEENQCWCATSVGKVPDLPETCSCQESCGSKRSRWVCSSLGQTMLPRQRSCRSTFMRPATLPQCLLRANSNKIVKDPASTGRNKDTTTHNDTQAHGEQPRWIFTRRSSNHIHFAAEHLKMSFWIAGSLESLKLKYWVFLLQMQKAFRVLQVSSGRKNIR